MATNNLQEFEERFLENLKVELEKYSKSEPIDFSEDEIAWKKK